MGPRGDQRSDTQVFPAGTPLPIVVQWQAATRARLAGTRVRSDLAATLRDSVRVYLDRPEVRRMVGYRARASALNAWLERMGPLTRRAISPRRVRAAMQAWLEAGYAPRTVHHRRTALMALYHALDGPKAPTPCDGVPSPVAHEPHSRQ